MSLPLSRDELIRRVKAGEAFEYFLFYGHKPPQDGSVDSSCLSQWFQIDFEVDGIVYPTAEHWMMAEKARLFGDDEMLGEILKAAGPKEAKAFGRKVQSFDQAVWAERRFEVVRRGNVEKFRQNPELKSFLLSTGETILVEAAGRDLIWGIGYGVNNEKARDPLQWRGTNLLGFVLVEVRGLLGRGGDED